ncbi:Linoleate 13S-lipoxygenase 2-1, chloroplastic [Vitis vinifera]|uniref:Linoleate 13S-lipoxygenase 2-1, chloroplastic n=1 Tax=Vitis vinifera TaxID=29760 RepID=A0A438JV30_VITVI|nr:Linoleate 13S-lipoxygenase 2-1, chloroplastic [Vitis vinifera]
MATQNLDMLKTQIHWPDNAGQTGLEEETISGYARRTGQKDGEVIYESEFVIPGDFGEIGAVLVENEHKNEMYLKHIVLNGSQMALLSSTVIHGLSQS